MDAGQKKETLRRLTFGNQVAEEEREALKDYFVKTQAWERIYNGEIDIVYGQKGAGKSALYVLVQDHSDELFDNNVLLISAENPQGAPAFKDIERDPPASEREFAGIWKLYFASLLGRVLKSYEIKNVHSARLFEYLEEIGLLVPEKTALGVVLTSVRRYVARFFRPKAVETSLSLDPVSGAPTGVGGKVIFEDPDIATVAKGYLSVDELLHIADQALGEAKYVAWLMIDRLDVAFDESSDLERNALRALFRAYRDIRSLNCIKPKIFLRTDIWKRITEDGFREATHMSRDIHLEWDKASLRNLVIRRLISNASVQVLYGVNKDTVLSTVSAQDNLFSRAFPDQVEVGEKQSTTFDWIVRRTADGTGRTQPRDVILFLNKVCEVQNRRLERGESEPSGEWLFDRTAFKEAMPALSEYKVTKVLYAEYPHIRKYIEALRERKTEHNVESLARLWDVEEPIATGIARTMRDIGFFEERVTKGEVTFWVPFVYRTYLAMSQGKVAELQAAPFDPRDWAFLEDDILGAEESSGPI